MTYTVSNGVRADDLGHETQFILPVDDCTDDVVERFEAMLYDTALGFTLTFGIGGWRGATEPIAIYRVASLSKMQRDALVRWLLHNTSCRDLYVVLPGGLAMGYSLTSEPDTQTSPLANTAPPFTGQHRPYPPGTLHGTRDTGWPHK